EKQTTTKNPHSSLFLPLLAFALERDFQAFPLECEFILTLDSQFPLQEKFAGWIMSGRQQLIGERHQYGLKPTGKPILKESLAAKPRGRISL
ncbi:hypothetical protein LEMLEM_LOCUS1666, partial [Lemmus lemmus]